MRKVTYETVVHKANIPLAAGESLSQFTSALSKALRDYATKKLSGANKNLYPYLVETYSDSVVFDCYIPASNGVTGSDGGSYKYYSAPYTRDKDGTFNFGKTVEVVRVSTFQAVGALPIASVTTGASVADVSTITSTKAKSPVPPNWEPVDKAIWNGAL